MDSRAEIRSGGKKLRKRRELDALIKTHSGVGKCFNSQGGVSSQDKLLSGSTDDAEDYNIPRVTLFSSKTKRKHIGLRIFGPFVMVLGIISSIGLMLWLYFDVKQEIYDYRKTINEVSATSQNLPETLQKWHETTAVIFKNHSSLLLKIHEFQLIMDEIRQNMSDCKDLFDAHKKYTKVEKVVADFGAKIEAISSDIEGMKIHYNTVVNQQKNLRDAVNSLKLNVSDVYNLAYEAVELPLNYSKEIKSLKFILFREVNALETNLTLVNDTLSQKIKYLNDELKRHKIKLDELLDHSENITSHVTSIENALPLLRKKVVGIGDLTKQLEIKVADIYNQSKILDITLKSWYSLHKKQSADARVGFHTDYGSNAALSKLPNDIDGNVQNIGKKQQAE